MSSRRIEKKSTQKSVSGASHSTFSVKKSLLAPSFQASSQPPSALQPPNYPSLNALESNKKFEEGIIKIFQLEKFKASPAERRSLGPGDDAAYLQRPFGVLKIGLRSLDGEGSEVHPESESLRASADLLIERVSANSISNKLKIYFQQLLPRNVCPRLALLGMRLIRPC